MAKEQTVTIEMKNLGKKIVKSLKSQPGKSFTRKQISKRYLDVASKSEINTVLEYLLQEKRIKLVSGNRIQYNQEQKKQVYREVVGTVDMAPSGVAYILVDDMPDDIRVEKKDTNKALDGDRVTVGLYASKKGNRPRGKILNIISRSQEFYIGRVELSADFAFVVPDNQNMSVDFFIKKRDINGAKDGDKVVVEFLDWPKNNKNPDGRIIEILGKSGVHDVEMKSILIENNFPLQFTEGVQRELDDLSASITSEEIKKRADMRDTLTFTIDPVDAKDFDDAISFNAFENNLYEIGVHIADVTHYVRPEMAIDKNGYRRATSVYLVDRVLPMLPEKLSNIICSLRPNEESLCFAVLFTMNAEGKIIKYDFKKTVIFSDKRFTYDEAFEEIQQAKGQFGEPLAIINKIAKQLRKKRYNEGSINFDSQELQFQLNDDGMIEAVRTKTRHDAHFLIEEFMLLANKTVAKFISTKQLGQQPYPFVYRVHDEPDPEKLQTFALNAAEYGHKVHTDNMKTLPMELNRFFEEIEGTPEQHTLESLAIRSMAKATYSTDNIGHYGLGFKYYTHFTSPIRRYPDMMVHRQLHEYLTTKKTWESKQQLQERCEHSSSMERKAVEAERESVKYFQTVYLENKVGEEFSGIITGVTSWGFYVEISDVFTEGLVRMKDLTDDDYTYDERRKQIVGSRTNTIFKNGKRVQVLVEHVSVEKRQVDLQYLRLL